MIDPLGFDIFGYLMFDFKANLSCTSAVTRVRTPSVTIFFQLKTWAFSYGPDV
jgi:hypothetical protein